MTTRDEREEKKKRKLEEDANRNDADSKRLREPPVTGQAEGGDLQRGRVGASKSEQVTDEKTGSAGKDRQPAGLHGHYPQFDRVAIEKAKEELLAAVIEVREKALARENNVGHTDAFTLEAERTEDDAEKLLALPLRIERVEPMAVDASAAGLQRAPSTASRLQSPGILEQSSLMPQCAMIGAVAHPAEPETSTNQALHMADNGMDLAATSPNKLPTRQYMIAKEQLHCTVLRPDGQQQHLASSSAAGAAAALQPLSWDRFPNYLGEGVRSRLLSLASLHLLDSGRCPSAVKDMPSNSNKVLLGAAPNCELYQERVIRALAGKLGVPLLSVDAATLKLDGDELKEEAAQSSGEDVFEMGRLGMGPPPDPYDSLDDEDPYQFDRRDRDKDYPQPTPRAPGVSGRRSFNFAFLPAPPPPRPTLRPRDPKAGAAPGTAAGAAGAADPPGKPPPQGTDEKVAAHAATKAALGKEGDPQHASLPTSFIGEDWGALQERIATMAAHAVASLTSDMGTFQGATPPPESEQRGGVPGQAVASPLRAPSPHEVAAAEAGAMGRERVAQGAAGAEVETGKRGEASLGKGGSPSDGAGAAGSPRHSGKALAGNRQAQRAQQGGDSAAAAAAAAEIQALPALSAAISVVAGTPPLPPEPTQVQDAPGRTAAVPSAAAAGGTAEQPAGQGGGACDVPTAAPRTAGAAAAQPSLKRNARVAYIGRLHPAVVASQDRLEAIESAISRIEAQGHSNARLQQYLPALLMRQRAALAAAGKASTHSGRMQGPDAPPIGSLGRVRSVSGEKVVVELDEPFSGGSAKPGGKEKVLFTCTAGECQQVDDKEDPWVSSFRALFDVIREESEKGPLIVSIKGLDRLIRSQAADHFRKLEALLAQMPPRCIIFACYCSRTLAREKAGGGGGGGTGGGGVFGARLAMDLLPGMDEMAGFLDRIGRHSLGKGHRKSSKGKLLAKMFPNTIELYAPNQEVHSKQWRKMVETDVSTMRTRSNRAALQKAMVKCGMACDDLAGVVISDCQLSRREVEQLLGLAVAEQLREEPEGSCLSGAQVQQTSAARQGEGEGAVRQEGGPLLDQKTAGEAAEQLHPAQGGVADVAAMEVEVQQPWILKAKHIAAAAQSLRQLQQEMVAQPERKGLKDVSADQYEKQLLSEVIPPEEINVKFDDIGALEAVKTTLHEVVILPLQRPELFTRGSLTKPTKGLLLFGPPGTGKTMLAKAVASESGAHFINVNMSAITSKWFGEGERLVRALFSLAHKLSPAVIFIDEIDSFLSKRGQSNNEHEALRKMKNEFMQHWDGLRTKQSDRVLVLAATNRPMDLDDAVVRRMPRRIFVPLPDAANRAKILQVILQDEAVEEGFSSEEVASWTEGYSGSDLKNLSIAAAYFPIRHFLDEERRRKQAGGGEQGHGQGQAGTAAGGGESTLAGDLEGREPSLRHISMADFKEAMKQVTSSVSDEAVSMSELKRWNDQYGEGGSRRVEKLHYFT